MCGIFGISVDKSSLKYSKYVRAIGLLIKFSEERGKDSAGIAIVGDDKIFIHKEVIPPKKMLKSARFKAVLNEGYRNSSKRIQFMGHCRLVTNGSFSNNKNNHPIDTAHLIGIHNGIILNAEEKFGGNKYRSVTREHWEAENDTTLFFNYINNVTKKHGNLGYAIANAYQRMEGAASIAIIDKSNGAIALASNTGSLYIAIGKHNNTFAFASERIFLQKLISRTNIFSGQFPVIEQLKPGELCSYQGNLVTPCFNVEPFLKYKKNPKLKQKKSIFQVLIKESLISSLRRCSKCVIPETYPFISFDKKGVCNFCNTHQLQPIKGKRALEVMLEKYRSKDGSPDCLVGLSGGRDSCYGLHVLIKEFGMNPVTYTYDWALSTDVSRRNVAKMIGSLGLENILRSAHIQKKRRHIRKNIEAWLKDPQMGMVPLFMAGDKDFYHYGRTLKKEMDLKLTIFCSGQNFEQREFIAGFCGVNSSVTSTARAYDYRFITKARMAFYYISRYIKNPAYINESFWDSIWSFITTFVLKDDFLYLYEYLPWKEDVINNLLTKKYGWEAYAEYGKNQWRAGDGQTAFTNYIWYQVAGFSEYDNFRSVQIREGILDRDEAIRLIEIDNRPKMETLEYFAYLVGFNLDDVLARINAIPKMY